jgi:hypothetical protein
VDCGQTVTEDIDHCPQMTQMAADTGRVAKATCTYLRIMHQRQLRTSMRSSNPRNPVIRG